MVVEYRSNNSGGFWWLDDEDWKKLEAAGWTVRWAATDPYYGKFATPDGRYMGALARSAYKVAATLSDAVKDWEAATGMDSRDEGCSCCGVPHIFDEVWEEEEST